MGIPTPQVKGECNSVCTCRDKLTTVVQQIVITPLLSPSCHVQVTLKMQCMLSVAALEDWLLLQGCIRCSRAEVLNLWNLCT